eukprot:3941273-Rhodomonas_salina.4
MVLPAVPESVLTQCMVLRYCYDMSGTDAVRMVLPAVPESIRSGLLATSFVGLDLFSLYGEPRMILRSCYAMPGTDLRYAGLGWVMTDCGTERCKCVPKRDALFDANAPRAKTVPLF